MKNYLSIAVLFFLLSGCDPDNKPIFETEYVKLKGDLNIATEAILLGDTLKFRLTIPNTVVNGTNQTINVGSVQEAYYSYRIFRIDTVNRKPYLTDSTRVKFFVNPGANNYNFCQPCYTGQAYVQLNSPYECVLNVVPLVIGVYYIEIVTQPGRIKLNNNYQAGLIVNFNTVDKYHAMIDSYLGNEFLAGATLNDQNGFGIYGFRVK